MSDGLKIKLWTIFVRFLPITSVNQTTRVTSIMHINQITTHYYHHDMNYIKL